MDMTDGMQKTKVCKILLINKWEIWSDLKKTKNKKQKTQNPYFQQAQDLRHS